VAKKHPTRENGVAGVVQWFDADEGWGVIVAPQVPGDCFVHFSSIEARGYREPCRSASEVHVRGSGVPAGWLPLPRPEGLVTDLTSSNLRHARQIRAGQGKPLRVSVRAVASLMTCPGKRRAAGLARRAAAVYARCSRLVAGYREEPELSIVARPAEVEACLSRRRSCLLRPCAAWSADISASSVCLLVFPGTRETQVSRHRHSPQGAPMTLLATWRWRRNLKGLP
jgi:hypothetical protein